jgi:caffeoyl-CoA O-methyltransferase
VEVGVFTGYSALVPALALPEDGHVTALDISEDWTRIARRYWTEAGVQGKIGLRLGPALQSMDELLGNGLAGTYDFAFIDAVKTNYPGYYERALEFVKPDGLIAVDNVLWGGNVIDPDKNDADTRAIRTLNEAMRDDERISLCVVPIGDGLSLTRKLP